MEWLNSLLPNLSLPINASDEELRGILVDGIVLCQLLNKLKPGCVTEVVICWIFNCKIAKFWLCSNVDNLCCIVYSMVVLFSLQSHGLRMSKGF